MAKFLVILNTVYIPIKGDNLSQKYLKGSMSDASLSCIYTEDEIREIHKNDDYRLLEANGYHEVSERIDNPVLSVVGMLNIKKAKWRAYSRARQV